EYGGKAETRGLVAIGVDTQHVCGVLVLLDATQSEAQLAVLNENGHGHTEDRERKHGVEEELRLRSHRNPQERKVQSLTAAVKVRQGVDDLAQHFRDDETRNCEIMPAQVQDGAAEKGGEEKRRHACRAPRKRHRRAMALQNSRSVGAEAEERCRRKRRVARESADE